MNPYPFHTLVCTHLIAMTLHPREDGDTGFSSNIPQSDGVIFTCSHNKPRVEGMGFQLVDRTTIALERPYKLPWHRVQNVDHSYNRRN